jgi:hypothetical protein
MAITRLEEKDYPQAVRAEMAKNGQAMPDGSYPIADKGDLQDAISRVGSGNAPQSEIKAHIMKRARALGATDMLPPSWTGSTAKMAESLRDRLQAAILAVYGRYVRGEDGELSERTLPVVGVYPDRVVLSESGIWWQIPYTDEGGVISLLQESEVSGLLAPIPPTVTGYADLMEAVGSDGTGSVWDVVMIQAGKTKSRPARYYKPEALRESIRLMEGASAFADHATKRQRSERPERSIREKIGQWSNVRYEPFTLPDGQLAEGVKGHLTVVDPEVRTRLMEAHRLNLPTFYGFSLVGEGRTKMGVINGERMEIVESIHRVDSIDCVTSPAAGGRIVSLVASDPGEGGDMTDEELRDLIARERQAAVAEAQAIWEGAPGGPPAPTPAPAVTNTEPTPNPTPDPAPAPAPTPAPAQPAAPAPTPEPVAAGAGVAPEMAEMREALRVMRVDQSRSQARDALTRTRLTEVSRNQVLQRVGELAQRRAVEAGEINAFIQEAIGHEAAIVQERFNPTGLSESRGSLGFHQGDDQAAKHFKAMMGMFQGEDIDGVKPFRSLKEAWGRWTGADSWDINPLAILRDFFGSAYDSELDHARIQESLSTATWAQVFADVVYQQAMRAYREMSYSSMWAPLCSEIQDVPDFQNQHWVRTGGYGNLPIVAETDTYPMLVTPGDEEVVYAIQKRGGLDDVTFEAIVNDRIGQVRRMPINMGRSAARTLYTFVMNLIITNPTMAYDSTALFHANHGNLGNASLSLDGINSMFIGMRKQTAFAESAEVLGQRNVPRFLLVPPELEQLANRIFNPSAQYVVSAANSSGSEIDPASFAGKGVTIMVMDTTGTGSTTAYFAVANPAEVETIAMGFLNGRREPEIFVQDQPNVGANLTADKQTMKVRHIYGGNVLDHRSFYEGHA